MTNERDKADMDARVSETYRELSAPRVPDHLNQRILRMAANQGPGMAAKGTMFWAFDINGKKIAPVVLKHAQPWTLRVAY